MIFTSRESVQHQQALLATLHGQLPQGVAVFDAQLRLIYANARWSTFLESATVRVDAASRGTHFADLFPDAEDLCEAALRCARTGQPVCLIGRPCVRDDGETFCDITLAPLIEDNLVTGLICVVDDVTTRRAQVDRASDAKARLAAFRVDISHALASFDNIDAVLQSCTEAMVRHAPAAVARIWVLDEAENVFRLRASAGLYTPLNGTDSRVPADDILQNTFPAHEPGMAVNLLHAHQLREPDWAAEHGLEACATHPLIVGGHVVGVMVMFARQSFDDGTILQLAAAADAIAQFLERKHVESSLREREIVFRGIFESAADGFTIYDLETRQMLEANPAICSMHGYAYDEFTSLRRSDLVHPDSHAKLGEYLTPIRAGHASRVHLQHVRKDGSVFPVAMQGSPILYRGRSAVLGIVRDMTQEQEAHERLEQRVAERTQELSLLFDISRDVASALELQPLLELILDQLKSVIDYTGTAILICEGDDLVVVGQRGPLSEEDVRHVRYPVAGLAPVWERLCRGDAVIIHDVRGESLEAGVFRAVVGADLDDRYEFIGSCLWAPLVAKDQLIGLLSVVCREPDAFESRQVEMAVGIARQAAVAIENARLHEQARTVAVLEERQRLARELHDSVSQALFGIGLGAETARSMLNHDPAKAVQPIDYVLQLAHAGMAEMRALIFELRPESLEQEGLVVALEKQAAATRARHAIEVNLALPNEPDIPFEMKETLYRIAHEAMHNTVKHARASSITVHLGCKLDSLEMAVIDDGAGFDSSDTFPGHLGLVSMQERVARLGGSVTIDSAPGQGTRVHVSLPLRHPDRRYRR